MIICETGRTLSNNISKSLGFGTCGREVKGDDGKLLYMTTTSLFRNDLDWNRVVKKLNLYKPRNIYCYACSDGSEPYSIFMGLNESSGRVPPIIARDIDFCVINDARSGRIYLSHHDEKAVKQIFAKDVFKKYFSSIGDKTRRTFQPASVFTKSINFSVGNFIKDAESLDYENSAIFCRNVWPYFSKSDIMKLLSIFAKKFTDRTMLFMGSFDFNSSNCNIKHLLECLAGLREDKYCKYLFMRK